MSIKTSFDILTALMDKRDEARFGFIRQILLMASGLLGILVALHKTASTDNSTRIAFALSLGLLSLGILFLSIALFEQVSVRRTQVLKWQQEVLSLLHDEEYKTKVISINPPKVYGIFEKIGYVSLVFSIICLTIYAILIA